MTPPRTIELSLECNDEGSRWFVFSREPDLAGVWTMTPESALVAWCDLARRELSALGKTPAGIVESAGKSETYLALVRMFPGERTAI